MNRFFQNIRNTLSKYGIDGFILMIIAVILLAWWHPGWGDQNGPFPLKKIASYGVSLIFFFYGLKLSPEKLKEGLRNFHLHWIIQASTFLLFPALAWLAWWIFKPDGGNTLWLGIFFLAALPSTVSSSVVMVSIAGGNIAGAIFNASISSLIGVIMTPLWMGLVMQTSGEGIDAIAVTKDLMIRIIFPVITGILLHPYLIGKISPFLNKLKMFDQSIILLIVYTAFCESFSEDLFSQLSWSKLFWLGLSMLILLAVVSAILYYICSFLGFHRSDKISAFFCGSQKSLVHGTVMSNVLFKSSSAAGIILLPTMLYHTIQLIASSIIAQQLSRKK
jgi:sodium/bile acid cotransporter 7